MLRTRTPMGPGFFIFFSHPAKPTGGGKGDGAAGRKGRAAYSREQRVFANYEQQKAVIEDITRLMTVEKEVIESDVQVLPEPVIDRIVETVSKGYNPQPSMLHYEVSEFEAMRRMEEFVREYLERENNNAIALILIMANI